MNLQQEDIVTIDTVEYCRFMNDINARHAVCCCITKTAFIRILLDIIQEQRSVIEKYASKSMPTVVVNINKQG